MKKLAIVEERDEDKYEHVLALRWYGSNGQEPVQLSPADTTAITVAEPRIKALIDGVMHSLSSARQDAVKAWEEELHPCEHTLTLRQLTTSHIPPSGTCLATTLAIFYFILCLGHRAGTLLEM
jgi:ubiquitin carboxyl-terminal hydrolase 5/13